MRYPLVLLLALTPLLNAQDADNYRKMIANQKKQQELMVNRLPLFPGPKRRVDQFFHLAFQDGRLVLNAAPVDLTNTRLLNRQHRVEIEGFASPCTFMAHSAGMPGGNQWYMYMNSTQFPADMEGMNTLSINVQYTPPPANASPRTRGTLAMLQIACNRSSLKRHYNVNFTQSNGQTMFGQPDGVQLNVNSSDNQGHNAENLNYHEADFATLRRKHPAAVRAHLRPLLRDLHLEGIFAVEPLIGWQVFAEEWPGDPELLRQVQQLVPALDHDQFSQRQSASDALQKLGPFGALTIYLLPRKGLTLEQENRLDAMVASFGFVASKEAQRMKTDPDFLLDAMYCTSPEIRRIAHRRLAEVARRTITFDPDAPEDVRTSRIEELRKELAPTPATKPVVKS